MKWIEDLLFTQHYELKKKERPTKSAKTTGIILVAVLMVLVVTAGIMALYSLGFLKSLGYGNSGRSIGKVLGLLVFGLSFGVLYFFYGKEEKYEKLIQKYYALDVEQQAWIYKKSLRKMVLLFLSLMTIIILLAVVGVNK